MALWIRRFRHLLSMPTIAWVAILLFVVTVVALWPHPGLTVLWPHAKHEAIFRWWGMLLQLFGIYSVLRELLERQKNVGGPTVLAGLKQWLSTWPTNDVRIPITGVAAIGLAGAVATARGYLGNAPGASVEQRLDSAERMIATLSQNLGAVQDALDAERKTREQTDAAERSERLAAIESFKKALDEASAKTLPLSMFGVFWLALGVILSSTSVEVADWMACLAR